MKEYGVHLNALRAFEATARHLSFSKAAEELSVSHSTISHHIASLEAGLGVKLFNRQNRKVELTKAGENLFPVLNSSFDGIKRALKETWSSTNRKVLNVAVTPSFANKWLVPRLRDFQALNPEIDINVSSSLTKVDYNAKNIHVGIRAGLGQWENLDAEHLMPIHMTPLGSPTLFNAHKVMTDPSEILQYPLIHADVSNGVGFEFEWLEWFKASGMPNVDIGAGLSFHDPGLALEAAINGLGFAIGYVELAKDDITQGRLVRPFQTDIRHPWSYFIVTPRNESMDKQTVLFCNWLKEQCFL